MLDRDREDRVLARAWLAGDGSAGAELADRHFVAILRFFQARVGLGAEDLAQGTFLVCCEALPRFREDSSFRTFLFAIAHKLLLRHYEGRGRTRPWIDLDSKIGAEGPSPSTLVRRCNEDERVREAVRQLPADVRECVELFYWDELTVAEISVVLALSTSAVKSRLYRGRNALRSVLHEEEQAQDP